MVSRQNIRLTGAALRESLEVCVARSELIEEGFVTGTQRALARFENEGLLDGGAEQEEGWHAMLPRLRALEEQVFRPARPGDDVRGPPGATAVGRVDDGNGARGSRGVAGRSRSPRR